MHHPFVISSILPKWVFGKEIASQLVYVINLKHLRDYLVIDTLPLNLYPIVTR